MSFLPPQMSRRHAPVLLPLLLTVACGGDAPPGADAPSTVDSALEAPVTVSFQEQVSPSAAYTGASDATLSESSPTLNGGADGLIRLDRDYPTGSGKTSNGLLRFDVSAIPATATVQSVRLTFNVRNATTGEGYSVFAAGRAWNEAQATWTLAATGSPWSAAGARGAADRGAVSFATLLPGATGSYGVDFNAAGIAAVQGWVANPATNLGFVLDAPTNLDGLELDSSEAATLANRPKLTVTYALPDGQGSAGNPGLPGLDNTGTTIPDTNYAIPSGAIFLATNGSDSNAGTQAAPVATISRAVALVPSGGTIVVRGGTYRDWLNNGAGNYRVATKPMTLQAYPHEQVWFDGTDVKPASAWTPDGAGHWYMDWSTPSFCNGGYYQYKYDAQPTTNTGPCAHFDMYGDPANPAAGDPQMVFIDGAYVHEVKTLAEATPGNFFYDWANRRIYIATNPSGHTVELAARPVALVLGSTGYSLKGLGFRRYATNEYSGTTSAAVYIGATNSLVENCVFTRMAAGSLSIKPQGGVVRRSVFANNGFTAVGSNGSTNSGTVVPDGLLMEENIVNANNTERFGTNCSRSCAQAGVKIAHMNGFTVRRNVFENNLGGAGFWCDEDCRGGVIVNNISRNNKIGIFYEVSDTGIIASNLIYDNTYAGIQTCAANTKIYNNTLVDNAAIDLWVYDDARNEQDRRGSDIGPDTVNVQVVNNILSGGNITTFKASRSDNNFTNTGPNTFFSAMDSNSYYRSGGTGKSLINWVDTGGVNYTSLSAMRATHGWESHGHDLASGGDPFFVNQGLRNYVVRPSSPAYLSGSPLPADVAQVLGVPAGTVTSRGALSWPEK
ncbi:right-handed parallel beta-helix repeat-containing protein [Corallococcus macrosporus]|uniref:Right-handed parallel beta-helix repeat-containing protein n=1 Tax=Corallococcus macrosporus TaxID=35 RepID=A0ABS3DIP7_9BACT|nr:DNRLRE domain-containing protein [Corallococcus macrosporus]MBN8231194.1 right-handed parallel beta-helix repeat-containing protein [Corallococcus macrosporus]